MTLTSVCAFAAPVLVAQAPTTKAAQLSTVSVPGVPNKPDLVTVIPFYEKPDETADEKTKVVIQAEVDGKRGVFIVDLGAPPFILNRTFLQPSATGGVDTVTQANSIPDSTTEKPSSWDRVHATVRIGTLLVGDFTDPMMPIFMKKDAPNPRHFNAFLGHAWGNFGWNFAPRLGNIGLSILEPFETIIDYTHRRLALIRLDSAGRRLVDVPAYTPKWSAPLIDVKVRDLTYWGIAVRPDGTLDTLNAANNTKTIILDTGTPGPMQLDDYLLQGYSFLRPFGVFGINHRTHQFVLYQ